MAAIEKSLFLNMVPAEKLYRNQSTHGMGVLRPSDSRILQRQFPVGWKYFTHGNIQRILRPLQDVYGPHVSESDILPRMLDAYLMYSPEEPTTDDERAALIEQLNDQAAVSYSNAQERTRVGAARYKEWRQKPSRLAARPESVLAKNSMIQTSRPFDRSTQETAFKVAFTRLNNQLPDVDQLKNFM
jgi:hypothetical protein